MRLKAGYRYIIRGGYSQPEFYEIEVLEISPNGYIKLKYVDGSIEWIPDSNLLLPVEELQSQTLKIKEIEEKIDKILEKLGEL